MGSQNTNTTATNLKGTKPVIDQTLLYFKSCMIIACVTCKLQGSVNNVVLCKQGTNCAETCHNNLHAF